MERQGTCTLLCVLVTVMCCLTVVWCADTGCTDRFGTCKYTSGGCSGGNFLRGLCDGPYNRQCCVPDYTYADRRCTGQRGTCQKTTTSCRGTYQSGLCGGPTNRRCCLPSSGGSTGSTGSGGQGGTNCHGSIDNLQPRGKASGGVAASQQEVRQHISALDAFKSCYLQVGRDNCIEPAVIAAIASRESHGGNFLRNGYGDNGRAWGIMQCDLRHSGLPCLNCEAKSCCHIRMMTERRLIPDIAAVARKHPGWSKSQVLQGAIAAYNFGVSNVQTWGGLDVGSTGNDYSNDVVARAQYLKSQRGYN